MKKILLLVLALAIAAGWLVYSRVFAPTPTADPCVAPPGVLVDGVALGTVRVFEDLDGDGEEDEGEPPLAGVEVFYPSLTEPTGEDGSTRIFIFKAGCVCDCWRHEGIHLIAPEGYHPTTPLDQSLTGDNLTYWFGFQKD